MFYRIDDFDEIDGPRFFRLATRVAAYSGVMAARVAKEQQDNANEQDTTVVGNSQAELANALPGLFDFSTTEGGS